MKTPQNDEKRLQHVWYYVQKIVQIVLHLRQIDRNHREVPSYAVSPVMSSRHACAVCAISPRDIAAPVPSACAFPCAPAPIRSLPIRFHHGFSVKSCQPESADTRSCPPPADFSRIDPDFPRKRPSIRPHATRS